MDGLRLLLLLGLLLLPTAVEAQWRRVSNCPGGICPPQQTNTRKITTLQYSVPSVVQQQQTNTIQSYTQSNRKHWSHPSTIQEHMSSTHGIPNPYGYSGEELLKWHDALHELERYGRLITGSLPQPRQTTVTQRSRTLKQPVRIISSVSISSSGNPICINCPIVN